MNGSVLTSSVCPRSWNSRVGYRSQDQATAHDQFPRLLGKCGQGELSRQKAGKTTAKPKQTQQGTAPKGAISMLQEYVQCSQTFIVPANYSVLQWDFDSQMADAATLEFRAIVSFLLEGVPHHVAGTWQAKKKDAQRDAAERALSLFVGSWSEQALNPQESCAQMENATSASEEELLKKCCRHLDMCGATAPSWSLRWEAGTCQAIVEIKLLDVPHQFAGSAQSSETEACADTARRVLWYLQRPGFENIYEPDPLGPAITTMKLPRPPAAWAGSAAEGALETAQRKTAIMRVQNRLQQTFELRPGLSAWSWTYEMDPDDEEWPVFCRATVNVPVISKVFTGDWMRGQRDAQLDTLTQVTQFLDQLEGSCS